MELPDDLQLVDRVKVAALQPNDVLVVECPTRISEETALRLNRMMSDVFPNHRCVVLADGLTLKVAAVAPPIVVKDQNEEV